MCKCFTRTSKNPDSFQDDLTRCVQRRGSRSIGSKGHAFKEALLRALLETDIRLYIPSEFGVDHTIHDFPHPEWDAKKHHFAIAQEVLPKSTKVIRVFIGLFLEDSIGWWFGFDTKKSVYEAVGSAEKKASFTSVDDVGKVLAVLAGMSVEELEKVPDQLHISGTSASMSEVAKLMVDAQNMPRSEISVKTIDAAEYRRKTMESGARDPAGYLRFLIGNRSIDHRSKAEGGIGDDNELVNPGGTRWKWKSMADYAAETYGRPWIN